MTEPTKLDAVRTALHDALVLAMADCGWPGRAHRLPPERMVAPAGWVDMATMHQAPTQTGQSVALTFPVVIAFSGTERTQVQLLDQMQAHGWQRLTAAGTQFQTVVQSAGPEDVNTGSAIVRGLVFRAQTTVQTKTLCQQTLTQATTGGTT